MKNEAIQNHSNHAYIHIETRPQSWKPQRFCFQNGCLQLQFFSHQPISRPSRPAHVWNSVSRASRTQNSRPDRGPASVIKALRFQSFRRDICSEMCYQFYIFLYGFIIDNHVENLFLFCFISTSVHDFLDIQFLKGTHMGFKRLSSLPCQTEGLNVASSPADLWDTFKMLGAQETETSPGKHLAWNVFWILLAPCKLILSTMAQGQASRKIANCHPFLYKFPTSASLHRTGTLRHLMLRTSSNHSDRVLMPFIRDFGTLMHFTCPEKSKR